MLSEWRVHGLEQLLLKTVIKKWGDCTRSNLSEARL